MTVPDENHRYLVVSPTYTYREVVLDDGTGPSYDIADVYLVDAPNKTTAKWAALRLGRTRGDTWAEPGYLHFGHPLRGVKVEPGDGENPEEWRGLYVLVEPCTTQEVES